MRSIAVLALKLSALVTVANALKISTIRNPSTPGNGCIIASSNAAGAPVVINQCDVDLVKEDWDYTGIVQNPLPQPLKVFGDKCLDVKDGVNADGTKLQIWDCVPGSTNQLWIHRNDDFTLQWAGTNKCVDLTDGSLEDGNVLQIWTCDSTNYNQKWSSGAVAHPDQGVTLEAMGRPPHLANVCMRAAQNADGAKVQLDICGQPIIPELVWTLPELGTTGQIKAFNGTKCLDLTDGNSSNGNSLQIWSCAEGNANQMWKVDGAPEQRLISWAGGNKCVEVKDQSFASGNDVAIYDCDPTSRKQYWDFHPTQ